MNFLKRHQRAVVPTAAAFALAAIALFLPLPAAADVAETIGGWIASIIYWIIQLLAQLLVVIINIMVAVAQYNNFLNAPAVVKGWAIVRDLANMFFIVVLLIIAFGTIMKIESYRYNRLLARLVVMAVLVNFSKFIAGFFIDFAQVIMITFVNAWRDAAAGNITSALGLQDIIQISGSVPPEFKNQGAILGALILGLFLLIVAVIVMSIIAIVLILRILALWFLVVLSPLAYLFRTYPSTEQYASRWWREFGKYVVTGPVVAFLLWLSLAIMSTPNALKLDNVIVSQKETTGIGVPDTAGPISATLTKIGQSETLLSYMVAIMLLVGTLIITKELGVAGGNLAGQWAERIRRMPGQAIGGALRPITDRTIAPVRQYLRQREQRRQATIQERAAGLGVTVDRGLSRTAGLGGRVMAGAGAWIRGGTFGEGFQRGTRGFQQAQLRIDQFKQDRQQVLSREMNITDPNLTEQTLRSMTKAMDQDRRLVAVRELIRRNMLKAGVADDVALVQQAEQYAGAGQVGRQFWEDTHKSSADLAKRAFFNDFDSLRGQQRYESALQAGLTSAALLAETDQNKFALKHGGNEGYLANLVLRVSRDEAAFKGNVDKMNEEARKEIFKHIDMTGEKLPMRQAVARITGEVGQAFADRRLGFQKKEAQEFVDRMGGDELMKRMAANAAKDANVIDLLRESPNVRPKHLKDFRDRGKEYQQAMLEGLQAYQKAKVGTRTLTNDRGDDNFKLDDWIRKNIFNVSKGKNNLYDLDTAAGRDVFERFTAQAEARDFADLKETDLFKTPESALDPRSLAHKATILRALGVKAKLKTLADYIVDEDYDIGNAALKAFVDELRDAVKNRPGTPETEAMQNRGRNMRRDLSLSGFVSIDSDLLRKTRGGAAATRSTTPSGPAPYRGTTRGFTAPLTGPAPAGPPPSVTPPTGRGGAAPFAGTPPQASARSTPPRTGPTTFGVVGGSSEREAPTSAAGFNLDNAMQQFERTMVQSGAAFSRSLAEAGRRIDDAVRHLEQQDARIGGEMRRKLSDLRQVRTERGGAVFDFEMKKYLRELTDHLRNLGKKTGQGPVPKPPPRATGGEGV